jgi:hypothetical protein
VAFLKVFPGLRYCDVDDMPFELWQRCRDEVDRMAG